MNYKDFIKDGIVLDFSKLHWQSDWNGYEVGYDDHDVVGLYTVPDLGVEIYVGNEGKILECWLAPNE